LPVLADPFRGRLPWLMEAPWRKTQQAEEFSRLQNAPVCAWLAFGDLIFTKF
jgi:hypothetical protein